MKMAVAGVVLAVSGLLQADTLSEMQTALQALKGQGALTLRVERHTWERDKGGAKTGQETFDLQDGPGGLKRTDGKNLPDGNWKAEKLTRAHLGLLELLKTGKVVEETAAVLDGHPVRKVRLSLSEDKDNPAATDGGAMAKLKRLLIEVTFWIGPDHLPLAVDKQVDIAGRAALFVSFSAKAVEHCRYLKVKDRLVALDASSEGQASAMGRDSAHRETLHCTLL